MRNTVLAFYTYYSPIIIITFLVCTFTLVLYFVYCRLGQAHNKMVYHAVEELPPPASTSPDPLY